MFLPGRNLGVLSLEIIRDGEVIFEQALTGMERAAPHLKTNDPGTLVPEPWTPKASTPAAEQG